MMNVKKKLIKVDKIISNDVKEDIRLLQNCMNENKFKVGTYLFAKKWEGVSQLDPFISYFMSNWVYKNNSWYFGYYLLQPMTNNSVEGVNAVIKKQYTKREKLIFSHFLEKMLELVRD